MLTSFPIPLTSAKPTHTSYLSSIFQAQFGATYYAKYMAQPAKITPDHKDKIKDESEEANTGNPLENLFLSIPTDEDLRRIYFWEARRAGEKERERFVS